MNIRRRKKKNEKSIEKWKKKLTEKLYKITTHKQMLMHAKRNGNTFGIDKQIKILAPETVTWEINNS